MNNKQRSLSNYISIVLLILSLIVMFTGWVTIYDKSLKNDAKEAISDFKFAINHLDRDDLDDLEDDLERYRINFSAKKVVKLMNHACNVLEDAAFSPLEMGEISIGWSKVEDNLDKIASLLGLSSKVDIVLDVVTDVMDSFLVMAVLAVAFIVIIIITLVREIMNADEKGYLFYIGAIVVVIYQMSVVSQINNKLALVAMAYRMDKLITSTFWPYSLLILAAAMFVVKLIFGKNSSSVNYGTMTNRANMGTMGNMAIPQMSYGGNAPGKVCSSCSTPLSADAAFCPNCGGSAVAMVNNVQQVSCRGCGMKLDNGTVFCPNCGTSTAPVANAPQMPSCKSCGIMLENGTVFCPNCGTRQD